MKNILKFGKSKLNNNLKLNNLYLNNINNKRIMFRIMCTINNNKQDYEIEYSSIDYNSFFKERTGLTATLWTLRSNLILTDRNYDINNKPIKKECISRPPWQSSVDITYNFNSDPKARNEYLRFDGGVRFDKILEDMDSLAGNVALLHAQNDDEYPINFVTAAVDRIDLLRRFPMTKDLVMEGKVIYTGTSSATINITIFLKEDCNHKICSANFIMVALDIFNNNKPMEINKLLLETDEEKHLFVKGEFDAQNRKEDRKKKLSRQKPTSDEAQLIHEIFMDKRNKMIDLNDIKLYKKMIDTKIEESKLMMPQHLNRAGKIFGGYLMKSAFELARTCAYLFTGFEHNPIFAASDDIEFIYPVSIGSIVKHEAFIACSDSDSNKKHSFVVIVRTIIKESSKNDKSVINEKISNLFSFTFIVPQKILPRVIPDTYEESMLYIYGNRCLRQSREIAIREGSLLAQYI